MPHYNPTWTQEQHAFWRQFFEPFVATVKIKEVTTKKGQVFRFKYVTAQNVQNRLDDLVGPHNWWDDYDLIGSSQSTVRCRLSVRTPWGDVVTKVGFGDAIMDTGEENDKGGESDSLKRAAVKFGIGRHLYDDGLPLLFEEEPPGAIEIPPPTRTPAAKKPEPKREDSKQAAEPVPATQAPRQTNQASLAKIPSAGPEFATWLNQLNTLYSVDVVSVAKKAAIKDGLEGCELQPVYWDQTVANNIGARMVQWLRRQSFYANELEDVYESIIKAKQNAAWALAFQLHGKMWPDYKLINGDERVHKFISNLTFATKTPVDDVFSCTNISSLDALTKLIRTQLEAEALGIK